MEEEEPGAPGSPEGNARESGMADPEGPETDSGTEPGNDVNGNPEEVPPSASYFDVGLLKGEETPAQVPDSVYPTTIEDLPDEILAEIFALLPLEVVKETLSRVSRRFQRMSENVSYYKQLTFSNSYGTLDVAGVLRSVPMLNRLELLSRKDVPVILELTRGCNTKLRMLKIASGKDERATGLTSSSLLAYLKHCPVLKRLVLKRVSLDEPDLFFGGLGAAATNVTSLNLNHNMQLGDAALTDVALGFGRSLVDARLYCLAFDRLGSVSPYGDGAVESLLTKSWATLKILKLNALGLTDASMTLIARCPQIERLHLYRMVNVHDDGLRLLSGLRRLKCLVVTVPRAITTGGWASFLGTRTGARLTRLTVSNSCTLDDCAFRLLVSHCRSLERLELPGCRQIGEMGLQHVSTTGPLPIQHLNLFSTKSSVSRSFWVIPVCFPQLKTLVYRPTESRHAAHLAELAQSMPRLEVRQTYRYP